MLKMASEPLKMTLNLEDLIKIFSFLSPEELVVASRVCTQWNAAANTNSLWRRHCMRRWSFCNLVSVPGEQTWRRYFIARYTLEKSMGSGRPGKDYSCKTLRGHSSSINDVVYITSNVVYNSVIMTDVVPIVASCAKEVMLWHVQDGKCIHKYDHAEVLADSPPTSDTIIKYLAFDPGHSWLASADSRGLVHVLETRELRTVCVLNTETDISAIKFGPSNAPAKDTGVVYLYMLARGGHFQVWDIRSPESPIKELDCTSLVGGEGIIEMNCDHLFALTAKRATSVDVFDLKSMNQEQYSYHGSSPLLCTVARITGSVNSLKWHPVKHNILVAGCSNGEIILWDTSQGGAKLSSANTVDRLAVTAMETRGGCLLVGTSRGALLLFDIRDEMNVTTLKTFHDHVKEITSIFVDPYHALTCSQDYSIRVYRWCQELKTDATGPTTLQSSYTLLGGSLQRAGQGFKKTICDYSSCIGLADNNTIKAYTFHM